MEGGTVAKLEEIFSLLVSLPGRPCENQVSLIEPGLRRTLFEKD
jgi:hypothetical protein